MISLSAPILGIIGLIVVLIAFIIWLFIREKNKKADNINSNLDVQIKKV